MFNPSGDWCCLYLLSLHLSFTIHMRVLCSVIISIPYHVYLWNPVLCLPAGVCFYPLRSLKLFLKPFFISSFQCWFHFEWKKAQNLGRKLMWKSLNLFWIYQPNFTSASCTKRDFILLECLILVWLKVRFGTFSEAKVLFQWFSMFFLQYYEIKWDARLR